jgi:hypothetical protein
VKGQRLRPGQKASTNRHSDLQKLPRLRLPYFIDLAPARIYRPDANRSALGPIVA